MKHIERIYIKILNIIIKPVSGIQQKNLICTVLLHILAFLYLYYRFQVKLSPESFFVFDGGVFAVAIAILLLLIAMLSVKGTLEASSKYSITGIIYMIFAVLIFVNGIIKPQALYASICLIIYVLILPFLYIAWNNREDIDLLFRMIAAAFVNTGIVFYVVNFIFFPRGAQETSGAYMGATGNPNTFGMICLSIFVCAVYMYIVFRKLRLFYAIVAAYSFGMIIVCQARTSMIAGMMALTVSVIYYIRQGKIFEKKPIQRILAIICLVIIVTIGIFITDKVSNITPPLAYAEENSESSIDALKDKFEIRGGGGLNSMLSQRIELWQYYGEKISFLGHSNKEYNIETAEDGVTLMPHNTLISLGYFYGAPTMFAMLAVQILVMIYVLKSIIISKTCKQKYKRSVPAIWRDSSSFVILVAIAYCSAGIVEELDHISLFGMTGLFYMAISLVISPNMDNNLKGGLHEIRTKTGREKTEY